jgi:ribosomal protein S18 acetylase RimI-like enzyme
MDLHGFLFFRTFVTVAFLINYLFTKKNRADPSHPCAKNLVQTFLFLKFVLMLLTSVDIRIATKADAALIADMSRRTFYDTFAAANTKKNMDKFLREQFSTQQLMAEVGTPGNIFLLAYCGNKPAGYARLRENNNPPELGDIPTLELARIYAVKEMIGKGIGNALMKESISIAKKTNKQIIWLGVWEENKRAIDFYLAQGFVKFSEHPFVLGDDVQTDWLMKRESF